MYQLFLRIFRWRNANKVTKIVTLGILFSLLGTASYVYADFYTWTQLTDPSFDTEWQAIATSDDGANVVAVRKTDPGGAQSVFYSTNGGVNWTESVNNSGNFPETLKSAAMKGDGTKAIIGGSEGVIYYSLNGGANFGAASVPSRDWLSLVVSPAGSYMYAVGYSPGGGNIFRSQDGSSWTALADATVPSINTNIGSISTDSSGEIVIIALSGLPLYRSLDAGNSWSAISGSPSRDIPYVDVSADGQTIVVAAGGGGDYIYVSHDAGVTWSTTISAHWTSVSVSKGGDFMAASTQDGHVYTSTDGGQTWETEASSPSNPYGTGIAMSANGQKLFLASSQAYLYSALDTTDPYLVRVTSNTPAGSYNAGDQIELVLHFNEPVFSTVPGFINLNSGGSCEAVVDSESYPYGQLDVPCMYTVGGGENTPNGGPLVVTSTSFGGDFTDGQGNILDDAFTGENLNVFGSYIIDTDAPTYPGSPDLYNEQDTGISNTDNIVSPSLVTYNPEAYYFSVSGCTDGVDYVSLKKDGSSLATTTCAADIATFLVPTSEFSDGTFTVSATQTDLAGNESASNGDIQFTVDSVAPILSSVTPTSSSSINSVTGESSDIAFYSSEGLGNNPFDNNTYHSKVTITRTGGNIDTGTHTCYLKGDALTAGSHTLDLSDTTDGCYDSDYAQYPNLPLVSGAIYSFLFELTDPAGNTGESVLRQNVLFDDTAPTIPGIPDLEDAFDSGVSSSDNITNSTTLNFTVSCESGNTVSLYDEDDNIIDTDDCEGGIAYVGGSGFSDGTHDFYATQTDLAGNESESSGTNNVTVDTVNGYSSPLSAPNLSASSDSGISNSDNITNESTLVFSGGDAGCLGYAYLYLDGVRIDNDLCVGETYSISYDVFELSEGEHTFTVRYGDDAGNTSSDSPQLAVIYDVGSPDAPGTPDLTSGSDSGTSSTDNITNATQPVITVSCLTNTYVTLKDSGSDLITNPCISGAASFQPTLTGGTHTFYATQQDLAGNESSNSDSLAVVIDTTTPTTSGAPDLGDSSDTGFSPTDDNTNDTTPTFTGSCTTGNAVTLYSSATSIGTATCESSTFTITASALTAGTKTITFKETDVAGNESSTSSSLTITIKTSAPTASLSSASAGTVDANFSATLTASEAITGFALGDITATNATLSNLASVNSSTYTFTVTPLANGALTLMLEDSTVSDIFGNLNAIDSNILNRTVELSSDEGGDTGGGGSGNTEPIAGPTGGGSTMSQFSMPIGFPGSIPLQNSTQSTTKTETGNTQKLSQQSGLLVNKAAFTNTGGKPYQFSRVLNTVSPQGVDVRKLQVFLNSTGFTIAKSGAGSFGRETNKFGAATKNALIKFQKAVGITPATGVFGPKTRDYVNKLLRTLVGPSTKSP